MKTFPARLHVLFARKQPLAVVLRRGPANQVATLMWDRRRDTFQLGQWLKGKIDGPLSDLSPRGGHLLCAVRKGMKTWTTISRAPYLTAVAFYPHDHDYSGGGGVWTGPYEYWVNTLQAAPSHDTREVHRSPVSNPLDGDSIYVHRLLRDGWERIDDGQDRRTMLFEKPLQHGWRLRKILHTGGGYIGSRSEWEEHALTHDRDNAAQRFPDWEWADLDRKRITWASGGKLFCGTIGRGGLQESTELHDFNAMQFEPIMSPYGG